MESKGLELIKAERIKQCEHRGYDIKHDRYATMGELSIAAAAYAVNKLPEGNKNILQGYKTKMFGVEIPYPWENKFDKRDVHGRLESLTIAGALIVAEIDRILDNANCDDCAHDDDTVYENVCCCNCCKNFSFFSPRSTSHSQDEIYHLTVNGNDVGNCLLFYRKDGKGYTLNLEQAHEFTQEDAIHTVEKASGKYRMWKRSTLQAVAQKHVDANNAMEYESSKTR